MTSLRTNDFADSPAMVLPPPNIHSFYASAHSHCIPHYQHLEPGNHSAARQQAAPGPSRKRSREGMESEVAVEQVKVQKILPEGGEGEGKGLSQEIGGAGDVVGASVKDEVCEDVQMAGADEMMASGGVTGTEEPTGDDGMPGTDELTGANTSHAQSNTTNLPSAQEPSIHNTAPN
ncbi:MAG: hypothetical protein Q9169_004216 [Polycauliona sp. 2 TL-2023]